MGLFSRRTAPRAGDPAAFWAWWERDGRDLVTAARERDDPAGTVQELTDAVARLHPELSFEVAPGELSTYVLVVTAAGDPELRAAARRWLLAAPASDEQWSYSDQRLPTSDPESLTLASGTGEDVDFARVQVTARAAGSRFDVVLHHPRFADLPEPARLQVAFLALDLTLGEYDVELWIGSVGTAEVALLDGFGLSALRSVVRDLARGHLDQDGRPTWALLRGDGPDGPVLAAAQVPLHPVTAPHLTEHAALTLPYDDRGPDGLPGDDALTALREVEDRIGGVLGPSGRVVAHQSSAGTRVLHVYLDEATDAARRLGEVARTWPGAAVTTTPDPRWEAVAHLRG